MCKLDFLPSSNNFPKEYFGSIQTDRNASETLISFKIDEFSKFIISNDRKGGPKHYARNIPWNIIVQTNNEKKINFFLFSYYYEK